MKRALLIMTVLIMVSLSYSQTRPDLKSEFSTAFATLASQTGTVPVKTKPITTSIPAPPATYLNSRDIRTVSIISIGTSVNAYSYGYAGGQKSILYANNNINTVTHLHRMGGALDPGGYSGDLGVDISTNGGTTWTNMNEIYTSNISGGTYNTDAARYPNHGIYNPAGNTDPDDAFITFFAPTLDGTNVPDSWGGYAYGRARINAYTDTTKNLSHSSAPYYQYIPDAYDVTEDGLAIAVDVNINWTSGSGVYQGSLLLSRGVWSESLEDFMFTRSLIDFPTNEENATPTHVSFAFGPDGQTGWIAVISDNESVTPLTGLRYFYPIFIQTTNGGITWSDPIAVRLDGPDGLPGVLNYLTDEQIEDLFGSPVPERDEIPYTTAFDCDLVVDMWGNPHLSVVVGVGASTEYSIVTASEYFAAFDISTTDGGTTWDGWMCGKMKQFRGTFGTDYTEDNRIQASSTQDGSKVFITWLDTHLEGALENNAPDIFARGVDVSVDEEYRCLSTDTSGAELPDYVTIYSEAMWQAYFAVTSRYTLDDGEGTYTIPFSYEALTTPFDPALPVQYKYIQDFTFTDDDFIPVTPDTADIVVVPASMTIYQEVSAFFSQVQGPLSDDTLTIFNVGDGALTIESVNTENMWILVSGVPNTPFEIDPGGSQTILVSIDWPLLEGETQTGIISIQSDDYDEALVEVPVTAIPAALPDLTVQDQLVDPATIEAGTSAYVSCNIVNQGTFEAASSMLRYYLSENNFYGSGDIELGASIVESLDSGQVSYQEDTLLIPAGTEAGLWFIIFFADADFNLVEIDESNNQAYFTINVEVSPPDLIVQNAEAEPLIIEPGETVNTVCDVLNQGSGISGGSTLNYYLSANSSYELDDLLLGSDTVGSLGPGEPAGQSQALLIPLTTDPGDWYILFFADAAGQVAELDENNNISGVQISVDTATSITDHFAGNIKIYPNPLTDNLHIDFSGIKQRPESIELINATGVPVRRFIVSQVNPCNMTFSIKDLSPGVYVIRIKFEKIVYRKVVVIK